MAKLVNKTTIAFVIFLFSIIFWSCDTQKSTENSDTVSVQIPAENNGSVGVNTDNESIASLILKTSNGTERLKEIGQTLEAALKNETLEMVDSASNYKGFTQYFNNSDDQFVDIQYYNNGEKVTGINFDIYLNTASDVNNLLNELVTDFDKTYGKSIKLNKQYTWQTPNNQELVLKDVSVNLAPGLQLSIAKKGEELTQ